MSGTGHNNANQARHNGGYTESPPVAIDWWSRQIALQLRNAPMPELTLEDGPSSPAYEPFGPGKKNLQDSLLNQPVQGPLRMIVLNQPLLPELSIQQQEAQYQHPQGQFPAGLENLVPHTNPGYVQPSQAQLQKWEDDYQQSLARQGWLPEDIEGSANETVKVHPQSSQHELQYLEDEYQRRLRKWREEYQQAHGHLPTGLSDTIEKHAPVDDQNPEYEHQPGQDKHQQLPHQLSETIGAILNNPVFQRKSSKASVQQWTYDDSQSLGHHSEGEDILMAEPGFEVPQQPLPQDQQGFTPQNLPQGEAGPSTQNFNIQSQSGSLNQQQPPTDPHPGEEAKQEPLIPFFSGQIAGHCPYPCPKCNLRFKKSVQMHSHCFACHNPSKPLVCPFHGCNTRFSDNNQLDIHLSGHDGKITCHFCGDFFLNYQALSWHKRSTGHGQVARKKDANSDEQVASQS